MFNISRRSPHEIGNSNHIQSWLPQMLRLRVQCGLSTLLLYGFCFSLVLGLRVFELTTLEKLYGVQRPSTIGMSNLSGHLVFIIMLSVLQPFALIGMIRVLTSSVRESPLDPGHWILVIAGIAIITSLVASFLIGQYFSADMASNQFAGMVAGVVERTIAAAGCVVAMFKLRSSAIWRTFFGYQAAVETAVIAWEATSYLTLSLAFYRMLPILGVGCIVLLASGSYQDIARRKFRNVLHWVGVAYMVVAQSIYVGVALLRL